MTCITLDPQRARFDFTNRDDNLAAPAELSAPPRKPPDRPPGTGGLNATATAAPDPPRRPNRKLDADVIAGLRFDETTGYWTIVWRSETAQP
jgi:hypothetical protein